MSGPSLTTITPIIKTTLLPGTIQFIESEQFITNELKKRGQVEQVGYEFSGTGKTGFSEGIRMFSWDGQVAPARQAQYKKWTGTTKNISGRIRVYKKLLDYTNGDAKAYINVVADEMESVQEALKSEKERMNYGDGGVTPIATATAASASGQTVTVTVDSTKYLRPGMPIDFLESNHTEITDGTSMEITNVMDDTNQFTFTAAATSSALTTLVAAINDGALVYHEDGYNNEFAGLKTWFGSVSNTVFGLDRSAAANAFFRPYLVRVKAAGGIETGAAAGTAQEWEEKDIHQVVSHLTIRKHADKKDLVGFADEGIAAYLIQLRQARGGYHEENPTVDGWPFEVVRFEKIPILSPNYMPTNCLNFVPMSKMGKFENSKLDFEDFAGDIWQWVHDYHAYEAYLTESFELGCERPDQGAWIGDLKGAYDA